MIFSVGTHKASVVPCEALVVGVYEGEKGLIGSLFVAPNSEPLDSALILLKHVIETLVGTPGLRRVETQLPHFALEQLEPSTQSLVEFLGNGSVHHEAEGVTVDNR